MIEVSLSEHPLDASACQEQVLSDEVGGVVVFVGTVRNRTSGREVTGLEFEAYGPMALREMEKIASRAVREWGLIHFVLHHRVGQLGIGEIPVVIAASAAHRDAAFQACRYAIDTLKETVPIWKKELFADGEVWVAAHP